MKIFLRIFFTLTSLAFYAGAHAQGYKLIIHLSEEDSLTVGNTFRYERYYQSIEDHEKDLKNEIKY